MTVYAKLENGKFIPAPYGTPEELLGRGYMAFTDDTADKYVTRGLLMDQIVDLDIKRIRAVCEPAEHLNGSTWLDYYTSQITDLRNKISEIETELNSIF